MRVVDCHVHTFSSPEVAGKILESFNRLYAIEFLNTGTGTIPELLAVMDRCGVETSVMANFAPPKILHENNLWCIGAARDNPRLAALVSLHPAMGGSLPARLEAYAAAGARGIKLHPMAQELDPADPQLTEVYRLGGELGLPVVFHSGPVANARLNAFADLEILLPVIDRHPGTTFVLTHMAGGGSEDLGRIADRHANVLFETSIVVSGREEILAFNPPSWGEDSRILEAVEAVGSDRILFGSDYPWGSPEHDLARLQAIPLGGADREAILGRNAERLFGLGKGR